MQNRHGELTIICKAKDLVNHTLQLTNNTKLFPKKVRFTLCQRIGVCARLRWNTVTE